MSRKRRLPSGHRRYLRSSATPPPKDRSTVTIESPRDFQRPTGEWVARKSGEVVVRSTDSTVVFRKLRNDRIRGAVTEFVREPAER